MMAVPEMFLEFSACCPHVDGQGYACMVCEVAATGHVTVSGGPNHGRCLALLCRHHASSDGYEEVSERLVQWMLGGLLSISDLGPGAAGAPEVTHHDHRDPLPEHNHQAMPQ
jgi:hypothetical protein